jgi:hypothetical protein
MPSTLHEEESMRIVRSTAFLFATAAATAGLWSGIASADPGTGDCRQGAQDALQAASSEGTRGDFVSDVIFGNEPNTTAPAPPNSGPEELSPGDQAGTIVPSQSPGPFVNQPGGNEPPRNDRGPQGFGGDELAAFLNSSC